MRTRVHIVAPYEAMIPIIQDCIPQFPQLAVKLNVGDLAKGVEHAVEAEKTERRSSSAAEERPN